MKLVFLGTRGYIESKSRRHKWHTALLAEHGGSRVMIDCGVHWRRRVRRIRPCAIVLTHAHPDHSEGLRDGAPCPVYATPSTWRDIDEYPLGERRPVKARGPFRIGRITFEAFRVEHSVNAPAVGYRVFAGRRAFFYAPDLVYIHQRAEALGGTSLYVGDGATPERPLVRKRGDRLIGHAAIRTQIGWCGREGVPRAIFTHCGSPIVGGDERKLRPRLRRWGDEWGVEVRIAHDGMTYEV